MVEANVLRMVGSLVLIVFLILAGAWFMRRAGLLRTGAGQSLKIIAAQSLGARSSVVVVQVDDARLVVGVTPQQITLLHTMPPGDTGLGAGQSSLAPTGQAGFARALRGALAVNRNAGLDNMRP
ncbi:flagellar biosynthetic protein FliO [Pusillimonas sp.]|uniref:flagellar biosynthetic protein FliO n=1 Tax=Pusillimonas sp. TaxID=3040095 RepID=UPI0037C83776